MSSLRRYFPILAFVAVIILVQALTSLTHTRFYLTQLTMTFYYALVVIGLCLVMGYAGQISLGHAGFFAMGGYLTSILTTHNVAAEWAPSVRAALKALHVLVESQDMAGANILCFAPWAAGGVAVVATIAVAFILGIPVLKLKGHYLAMATLGFGVIVYRVVLGTRLCGEADGISGIPPFPLFAGLEIGGAADAKIQNYYIAAALVVAGMILLLNLIHSRVGRALRAIHGAEDAANAAGVDTARYKLMAFVISAAFAAVAGVGLAHYNGGIGPTEAGIMKSIRYVAIVAVGGMASLWGSLIMALVLNFLSLRGYFGSYDDAVFGAILILVMMFAPHGILRLPWPALLRRLRPGKISA